MRILTEGAQLADRYTLLRRLGGGRVSEVWLARDSRSEHRVALKFAAGEDLAKQSELLEREWRISSRLMHANIVRVFEYHDDIEGPFFALQYVGQTHIGVLTDADSAESMRPIAMVADGLRYAHTKGVVHRDVKAENILLDRRGNPCIADFGVAAAVGSEEMLASGSEVASSPQQLEGDAASPADDIYALGVLMHELLTGLPPDGSASQEIRNVRSAGSAVSAELLELMHDMLSLNAAQRPDAETVVERLNATGISAGPAPSRFVAGEGAIDELVESAEPVQAMRRDSARLATARENDTTSGVSPRILYASLGVALIALIGVVFILPNFLDRESSMVEDEIAEVNKAADDEAPVTETETDRVRNDAGPARSDTSFSENISGAAGPKAATDEALGDLLSQLERLRYRAIDRWGGQAYLDAVDIYAQGDQAYVARNYRLAGEKYRQASELLEPFFDRIETVFDETLAAATESFSNGDHFEAVRLYDLAVAITPGHREAEAGFERATKLQGVLTLVEQGVQLERDLELDAAELAFEKALEMDAAWEPAAQGLERVKIAINDLSFEQRMTEGFDSLVTGDFDSARAAFNAAKLLKPSSSQPTDGLLQLDQEVRLSEIQRLEREAQSLDQAEQWETSVSAYEEILKIDPDLKFALEGLSTARSRSALHARLAGFIEEPDSLSDPVTMQNATKTLLDIARFDPVGPRLEDQKSELSRLLKRAATPLRVQLVSDSLTNVSIFRVGQFGSFALKDIELRPGNYVAVGIRPGYRDVRIEFRVAPEADLLPIVVQCEEQI